ncbi:MAG: ferrochelatase [Bacteroidota bacterium]
MDNNFAQRKTTASLFGKKGVLIVNLGTPDEPSRGAVYRYLRQFLTDGRVLDVPWLPRQILVQGIIAPLRSGQSAKAYKELWTEEGSPLKFYGERIAAGVQDRLGDDFIVKLAMRYQSPSIESALRELRKEEVAEIIVFPMFPQYAGATTGSVHQEVMRIVGKWPNIPNLKLINCYYDDPAMIELYARNGRAFDLDSYDHIFFSYHGLPTSQLKKADDGNHCQKVDNCCSYIGRHNQFCYGAQCHATSRAIASNLGLKEDQYTTTFQSRLGPVPWLKPYTIDELKSRAKAGAKRILCFSPAFVADCLETIIEIGEEYQEEFEELGGERIDLVPSLNDDPVWMDIITNLVKAQACMLQPTS